jgi:hypothetical protein
MRKKKSKMCFLLTDRGYSLWKYQRFRILYRLLCLDWENGMEKKGKFACWVLKFLAYWYLILFCFVIS